MSSLPRDKTLDASLALLREGYAYIGNRCRQLDTEVFETRLLGRSTICCRGAEPARRFYDETIMRRRDAMPGWVKVPLLGRGGVQGLDDAAHRHRKAMFMQLMTEDRLRAMTDLFREELRQAACRWTATESPVVVRDEMRDLLCRAVCRWSGVPLTEQEVAERAKDMDLMVVGSARLARRHWQAMAARRRSERWAARLVERTRSGDLTPPADSALAVVSAHRDHATATELPSRVAAVELLNVLRPTVALTRYVVFAALALHHFPASRRALMDGEASAEAFALEVRRFYPFFPFAAAVVRKPFTWRGENVPEGRRVLLDLYGTNHDPHLWEAPEAFEPARFRGRDVDAFELIPQGGGSHWVHHRCAGEWLTMGVLETAVQFLTRELEYSVPEQDLEIPFDCFPTGPRSGFVITPRFVV